MCTAAWTSHHSMKYPFIPRLWCYHLLFPFLSLTFPNSNNVRDRKLLGEGSIQARVSCRAGLRDHKIKSLPSKCQFPMALWPGLPGVCVGYGASWAVQLWRPLCTEAFMENDWAVSPQQMWWEIKPKEPGCSLGGDTRNWEASQGNHRRKPKKWRYFHQFQKMGLT